MVIRMRHTRAHTKKRRSHHALENPAISTDKESDTPHLRHRVNPQTGMYRGKQVLDVEKKIQKKLERQKAKEKELGIEKSEDKK